MGYQLICNRAPRPLLSLYELTEKEREEFGYIEDDVSARLVRYKGSIYDAFDTQRIEPDSFRAHPTGGAMRVHPGEPLAYFDSIITESFFSGIVFRFVDDGESVIVGRFYS